MKGPLGWLMQALRRLREDPQHAQTFPTIRARGGSDLDAIEEMLALRLQRLARLQLDAERAGLLGSRYAVPPVNLVREQEELTFPWLAVVEYGHGLASDYDELLLLKGV